MNNLHSPLELIRDAFEHVTSHFWTFAGIVAIPLILATLLAWLLPEGGKFMPGTIALAVIVGIGLAIIQILSSVGLIVAVHEGATRSIASYYKDALPLVLPVLWVAIMSSVVTLAGFILLIIPGIIISIYLAVASYTVVLDGHRGIDALKQSHALIKGRWWATFVRLLVMVVIALLVSVVVGGASALVEFALPAFGDFVAGILNLALNLFIVPFSVVFLYLLYTNLKETHYEEAVASPVAQVPQPSE